jgi:hypothetical protein
MAGKFRLQRDKGVLGTEPGRMSKVKVSAGLMTV